MISGWCERVSEDSRVIGVISGWCERVSEDSRVIGVISGWCEHVSEDSRVIGVIKVKKYSMTKSLPVENLLPHNVGSIINYLQ